METRTFLSNHQHGKSIKSSNLSDFLAQKAYKSVHTTKSDHERTAITQSRETCPALPEEPSPDLEKTRTRPKMLSEILQAIRNYARAWGLIRPLRLWPFFLIPALISLFLGALIAWSAWNVAGTASSWLIAHYPWKLGAALVAKIAGLFSSLLLAALGFILYKNLVMVLAGPFMSPLSEKVEHHLTGRKAPSTWNFIRLIRDLLRGLRIALRNIIRELLLTFLILLLGLLPVFSPFTSIAVLLVQAYFAGFGNMDYTLERQFNYRESVRFVQRHKGLALGNGILFMLLLFTGIGFLIAPPWATVASTLDTIEALEKEKN